MIDQEIKEILAKQFGIKAETILPESHLVNDLAADSLDLVEITMTLENRYKIAIEDAEADVARTFGKLTTLVVNKIATK